VTAGGPVHVVVVVVDIVAWGPSKAVKRILYGVGDVIMYWRIMKP
jgi:hypothetical protein